MNEFLWKRRNDKVVRRNNKIRTCCCDNPGTFFWEMVPCDALMSHRINCYELDPCQHVNRRFAEIGSYSADYNLSVCECQQLYLYGITDQIYTSAQTNAVQVDFTGSGAASVTWGANSVVIVDGFSGTTTLLFEDYLTLTAIFAAIAAIPGGFWSFTTVITLDNNLPPYVLAPDTLNYVGAGTQYLDTTASTFTLTWRGEVTAAITFSTNGNTLASNIETALNNLSFGIVFEVVYSAQSDYNQGYFDVLIGGSYCGAQQPNITFSRVNLLYQNGYTNTRWRYGDRDCNWGNTATENYRWFGSVDYCGYEQDSGIGPAIYVSGVHCCPQRGATINKPQNIDTTVTGYYKGQDWENLDTTVTIDNNCFGIRPPWFIMGKQGRLNIDPSNYSFRPYVTTETSWASASGLTQFPCDCTPELFMGLFHPNVPWGPFGSYYPNIETAAHPAWTTYSSTSYFVASGFVSRYGWDYRPQAEIRTQGTWLETTGLVLSFTINHPCPFYVGGNFIFDDRVTAKLDTNTVNSASGWTIIQHGVTGARTILSYNPSGKTVKDFVDAVNNIRIRGSGNQKCEVFSFCVASNSVTGVPLKFVVNTTSDIWDLGKNNADIGQNDWQNIYHPLQDTQIKSGANIMMGTKSYWEMFVEKIAAQCYTENPTGYLPGWSPNTKPFIYNKDPGGIIETDPTKIYAELPPSCRTSRNLPKEHSNVIAESERDTPWFTVIQGCTKNILNISLTTGILNLDSFDQYKYITSGRMLVLQAMVTGAIARSGVFNTNKQGSGYSHYDLINDINSFTWGRVVSPSTLYQPFYATGRFDSYPIWLDDHSWANGSNKPVDPFSGGATRTTTNYAAVEPILVTAPTGANFNNSFDIYSYVRRRCEHYHPTGTLYNNEFRLKHCVPPDAQTYASGITIIDLEGDKVVDNGWLISYGCNSYVCKTEWYIKARRCSCDTVYRCTSGPGAVGSYIKHPYNREGDQFDNNSFWSQESYGSPCNNVVVNQPDFYVCDNNLHPDCDIPMLVKVPYQVIAKDYRTACTGIYYVYYDDQPDELGCDINWQFCSDEDNGWCQYIDPANLQKVSKQNIPRTWPPTAYVAERSNIPFCSTNLFYYPIEEWCNCTFPRTTNPCGWDQICNVYTMVPPEYLGADGFACNVPTLAEVSQLCVFFRPYINNLTVGDICGGAAFTSKSTSESCSLLPACARVDINCGTKCCECFWNCTDDGCSTDLVRNPCSRQFTWNSEEDITNIPTDCGWFGQVGGGAGACNYGCCLQGAATFIRAKNLGVRYNYNQTQNFTYYQHTCGCLGVEGEAVTTYDVTSVNCAGDYYDPCDASPTPPSSGQPICGNRATDALCTGPVTTSLDCAGFEFSYFPNNGSFGSCDTSINCNTTGLVIGRDCGTSCGGSYGCAGGFSENYRNDCNTGDFELCGEGTQTCSYTLRTRADGSTSIYTGCNPGDFTLRLEDGSFANIVTEYSVTKTITPQTCGSCPTDSVSLVTYAHVSGWAQDYTKWRCGYGNNKISFVINSGYVYP